MKKIFTLFWLCLIGQSLDAQIICNPNGNLVLFTNYDGGTLNINVDVNIPNLKIGIVSYEAVAINLSGTYVNNVTAVYYAGYNSPNNTNCSPNVPTTVITGAPGAATTSILFAPNSPLANANGYPSIICGYSCSTTTNQGGCNTVDQIEAYFAAVFPGSVLRSHKVQYNCWSGSQLVSTGGTCCSAGAPLAVNVQITMPTCTGACNGSATATASGGIAPYTFQWVPGPASANYPNLCPGVYSVIVTDAASNSTSANVIIPNPPPITQTINQSACSSYFFNGNNLNASGTYYDTLLSAQGCDSLITLNLTIVNLNAGVTQAGNLLTASPTGANYQWFNCTTNQLVPNATAQTYVATTSGIYAAIVTQSGCTDTSACVTVVTTGFNTAYQEPDVQVYPNPFRDVVQIELRGSTGIHEARLLDATGRVLKQFRVEEKVQLDTRTLPSGMYFVEVNGIRKRFRMTK